jgi:transposase
MLAIPASTSGLLKRIAWLVQCAAIVLVRRKGPRTVSFKPKAEFEILQWARQREHTQAFKERYAKRAGIEGTISQGTRSFGLRRSRYIGQAKTHLQHILIAIAINLSRFVNWINQVPQAATRTSAFAALAQV